MTNNKPPEDEVVLEIEELEQELKRIEREQGLENLTSQEVAHKTLQELEAEYKRVHSEFNVLIAQGLEADMVLIGLYFFEWFEGELAQLKHPYLDQYPSC